MQFKIAVLPIVVLAVVFQNQISGCQANFREGRQGPVCCLTYTDVTIRPGTCPSVVSCPYSTYPGCMDQCNQDSDCPEPQKCCCSDRCGNQCVSPVGGGWPSA